MTTLTNKRIVFVFPGGRVRIRHPIDTERPRDETDAELLERFASDRRQLETDEDLLKRLRPMRAPQEKRDDFIKRVDHLRERAETDAELLARVKDRRRKGETEDEFVNRLAGDVPQGAQSVMIVDAAELDQLVERKAGGNVLKRRTP